MAVFIIILNDARHGLHCHPVKTQPIFSTHSMAEAPAKNIKGFEPPVKSLLAILRSLEKSLEVRGMLIFGQHKFAWFASVSTVCNTLLSLFESKEERVPIPIFFAIAGITATEDCNVMNRGFVWATDPANFGLMNSKACFIFLRAQAQSVSSMFIQTKETSSMQ